MSIFNNHAAFITGVGESSAEHGKMNFLQNEKYRRLPIYLLFMMIQVVSVTPAKLVHSGNAEIAERLTDEIRRRVGPVVSFSGLKLCVPIMKLVTVTAMALIMSLGLMIYQCRYHGLSAANSIETG